MALYTWSAQVLLVTFQRPKPTSGISYPLLSLTMGTEGAMFVYGLPKLGLLIRGHGTRRCRICPGPFTSSHISTNLPIRFAGLRLGGGVTVPRDLAADKSHQACYHHLWSSHMTKIQGAVEKIHSRCCGSCCHQRSFQFVWKVLAS